MESIKEILIQIHKSSKKSRVKTSVFLKKIDEILFKKRERLDAGTMRMLLLGVDADIHGLLQICGVRSKFKGSLKNSSFYCLSLIVRLFNEHSQRKDLLQMFYDFDEEEFLSMKLADHILSYKKPAQTDAYEIAKLIKLKRPYMNVKQYISERIAQEKFADWMKNFKSDQVAKQINQREWSDQPGGGSSSNSGDADASGQNQQQTIAKNMIESVDMRASNVRARDEKMKKKITYFQEVHLRNFERNLEYYKVTFSDPLFSAFQDDESASMKQSSKSDPNKVRKRNANKALMLQSFAKKICKPADLIAEIEKNSGNLDSNQANMSVDEIIPKIHIESPDFDPIVFLTIFHTKTDNKILTEAATALLSQQKMNFAVNKSLVYYYLESFLDVFRGVKRSHLTFIQVEAQSSNSFFNTIKVSQTRIEQVVNKLNAELTSMKGECSTMRQVLTFLHKNSLMLTLPSDLKKAYNRHDFERISKLFQQAFPYLRRFRGLKIFNSVYMEINRILQMSQDMVIALVERHLDDSAKMLQYTNILLDLQYDYNATTVTAAIADQQTSVDTKNNSKGLPKHNLSRLVKFLSKRLLQSIEKNTFSVKNVNKNEDKQNEQDHDSQFNTGTSTLTIAVESTERQRKLKLIKTIQFDCDRLEQFAFENNIASEEDSSTDKPVKIRDVEVYLQENLLRFRNYHALLTQYAQGDFDYKLPQSTATATTAAASSPLNHFQIIQSSLVSVVSQCVAFIERKYDIKQVMQEKQLEKQDLKDLLKLAKKDISSCAKILIIARQLDSLPSNRGKNKTSTVTVADLQERLLKIAYGVELADLKSNRLEEYEFYPNLQISKSFMNDDEFSSTFSAFIFETIFASVLYLLSLKLLRSEDLMHLHRRFLLEAISMSFKIAFSTILKEHSKQVNSQSEYAIATGQGTTAALKVYEKDEVYLIILSNIVSFKQYQCKVLLRSIYAAKDEDDAKSHHAAAAVRFTKQQTDEAVDKQAESIRELMQQMITDIMGKLSVMKAAKLVEGYMDLFAITTPSSANASKIGGGGGGGATTAADTAIGVNFDSNSVYNESVLQQLNKEESDSDKISRYEIRYRLLDLLSDIDQYVQTISLHCAQSFIRDLPPLLFVEILTQFKRIIQEQQNAMTVLLLKQLRIEFEFLQSITVSIKSIASQQLFSAIYALIAKVFQQNFGQDAKSIETFKVDESKFNKVVRETKFKTKLNFRAFLGA